MRAVKSQVVATPSERLLTPDEVCERLGVTRRWIRRQVDKGLLQPVKVGQFNRFRESVIDDIVVNGFHLGD